MNCRSRLEVSALTVGLPPGGDRACAVQNVSLTLYPGQTHCLVGESGSGKSIIGQAILGMLPPSLPKLAGNLVLDGESLPEQQSLDFNALRSKKLAIVFQDATASLNPVKRIGTQLGEILKVHGIPSAEIKTRVLAALEAVQLDDPAGKMRAYPHQLSGGQAQRVVIAAALQLKPDVLIADEPTTALDVTTQASILALLDDLKTRFGLAVLFITHDFGVVSEIADHVTVLKDGEVVETGGARQVLSDPQHAYTQALLAAAEPFATAYRPSTDAILLRATNVTVTYHGASFLNRSVKTAVKSVSLTIESGRTLGLVGESGSGKSSLARGILRLEPIESGSIEFRGLDVTQLKGSALKEFRKSVQVVLQDPYSALNPRQTIRSAIAEGPIIHGEDPVKARARAEELLELTGLQAQAADRYPHEFSGGQRQRICIARALALDPEVLVADESVSALDVSIQAQILDLFADLQKKFGFAMLFITHDLRVARAICDDLIVMQKGEVVERGRADAVLGDPQHAYTRRLVAAAPKLDLSPEDCIA